MNDARKLKLNTVAVKLGCSSCRKLKLSDIFNPKPKQPSSSSYRKLSHEDHPNIDKAETRLSVGFGRVMEGSVAVEKVCKDDPYLEFRSSMLEVIVENGLVWSEDDLKELLECFLLLNSEVHHESIFRAFADVWSVVVCSVSDLKKLGSGGSAHDFLEGARDDMI